ncbi:MAG: cytochrome c [Acidobacteria bacterium]|nr:cytochrome c [Acidobacteriota bacterium]
MYRNAIHAGVVCAATAFMLGGAFSGHALAQESGPTFSKDVAPIFYEKCVTCHREGEVAPMSLITFREARPWARAIHEKVTTREMPPWHADRRYGAFSNDLSLTQPEIDTIAAWVTSGALEGNPAELPPLPEFTEGWQIGTPDVVFEMPVAFEVPATGTVDYQYFDVPTGFTKDMWMQAGEVRPDDRQHVHHIVIYVKEPEPNNRPQVVSVKPILAEGQQLPRRLERASDDGRPRGGDAMLVNWAVGEEPPVHAPGTAKRIPAGSTLIFNLHYTTDGEPGLDRSKLGLIFADEPPAREVRTGLIANPLFELPPGAANYEVAAEATFSDDVKVWTLHPHMHLRGKDMTYTVTYPDGRSEIILSVPRFDFGWQTDYYLAEPLLIPKGSKIHVSAHFDNSAANRDNPDPTAAVRWGDQTWEEMMIGFFTYTVEGQTAAKNSAQ